MGWYRTCSNEPQLEIFSEVQDAKREDELLTAFRDKVVTKKIDQGYVSAT